MPPTLPSPPSPLPSPSPYLKGRSRRIRHPFEPPHLLSAQAKAEHSNDHGQTILHPPRQVTTTIIMFGRCCGTRGWSEATAVIACTWGVTSKDEALPLFPHLNFFCTCFQIPHCRYRLHMSVLTQPSSWKFWLSTPVLVNTSRTGATD